MAAVFMPTAAAGTGYAIGDVEDIGVDENGDPVCLARWYRQTGDKFAPYPLLDDGKHYEDWVLIETVLVGFDALVGGGKLSAQVTADISEMLQKKGWKPAAAAPAGGFGSGGGSGSGSSKPAVAAKAPRAAAAAAAKPVSAERKYAMLVEESKASVASESADGAAAGKRTTRAAAAASARGGACSSASSSAKKVPKERKSVAAMELDA
jgi:hypothetical protein